MTSTILDTPVLFAPNNAAHILGISRSKIYDLMRNGDLAWVPCGTDRRIHIDEIKRLATEGIPSTAKKARRVELI